MGRRGGVRSQLKAYQRQVAALSLQKVWRGSQHRRQHGVIEFAPRPNEHRAAEPFWVKGADVNSELDMYHGPVQLPEGHVLSVPSASPNRSEPLPRRGRGPVGSDAPVRKMSRGDGTARSSVGGCGDGNGLVSTQMPLLNHALDNGATRIQSFARGRRARRAYARKRAAATRVQSIVRRYLSTLAVRAERRRRKVDFAIGGFAGAHRGGVTGSLHEWLAANGVGGARNGGGGGDGDSARGRDVEQALAVRAGVTTVEQLAQLSESEVAALAARVFRGPSGHGQDPNEQVFVDAVTLLRLTFLATHA